MGTVNVRQKTDTGETKDRNITKIIRGTLRSVTGVTG